MTRNLTTQVAAISLATIMTLAVLLGLNSLASREHAATQMAKAAAGQPA